jgi:hypothetical protein
MQSPFAVVLCSHKLSVMARFGDLSLWHWMQSSFLGRVNFPGMPPPVLKTVAGVLVIPGVLNVPELS